MPTSPNTNTSDRGVGSSWTCCLLFWTFVFFSPSPLKTWDLYCDVTLSKPIPPPVRFYWWQRDERVIDSTIRFSSRNSGGMSAEVRRNSSKTANGLESDPDGIRSIRRELSTEHTHNEWDNIMESSSRGRDAVEQHDQHRELIEKCVLPVWCIHMLMNVWCWT